MIDLSQMKFPTRLPPSTFDIPVDPYPCNAHCGKVIDPTLDGGYSCTTMSEWHCADCHFGNHNQKEP